MGRHWAVIVEDSGYCYVALGKTKDRMFLNEITIGNKLGEEGPPYPACRRFMPFASVRTKMRQYTQKELIALPHRISDKLEAQSKRESNWISRREESEIPPPEDSPVRLQGQSQGRTRTTVRCPAADRSGPGAARCFADSSGGFRTEGASDRCLYSLTPADEAPAQ